MASSLQWYFTYNFMADFIYMIKEKKKERSRPQGSGSRLATTWRDSPRQSERHHPLRTVKYVYYVLVNSFMSGSGA